ncbi:MAG: SpvB/TcaC N-terminal domain-containing protein, partial [Nanoarchaeota archaeon]|nr:SpvB/TcaC N-terminal domain-containing protein [Nanoarchaeota archaeon]
MLRRGKGMWKYFSVLAVLLLIIPVVTATVQDPFRPYIHKASVPESPKLQVFGDYETLLFPGAATYTYPISVPKGTNNLQPTLQLTYNSQSMKQRPSVVGAGWSLTENSILRHINFTPGNITDDYFLLSLEGSLHRLTYSPSERLWHTVQETFMKLENKSGAAHGNNTYWLITKKDGKKYRFGYNSDSELGSNTGKNYSAKWSLDRVEDTFGNSIQYAYLENHFSNDTGAVYLSSIMYNNDS